MRERACPGAAPTHAGRLAVATAMVHDRGVRGGARSEMAELGLRVMLPAPLQRVMPWLIHGSARFTRPLTLGVRAVLTREGAAGPEVFLVRHSYVPGWHLPGGAVEAGETVADAVAREIREECALEVTGTPELFGLYFNRVASRRDHVAVFRVRDFAVLGPREGGPRDRRGRVPSRRGPADRPPRPRPGPGWPRCSRAGPSRPIGEATRAGVAASTAPVHAV